MAANCLRPTPGCGTKDIETQLPFQSLPSALTILTSMITPALLITAAGAFIFSTSSRLGRVVDRVRAIADKLDELMCPKPAVELVEERKAMLVGQLAQLSKRADILQRSLTVFYMASGAFVASSVAIGVVAVFSSTLTWIPVALGLLGACFLFYGSVMLIFEARLAVNALRSETSCLRRLVSYEGTKSSSFRLTFCNLPPHPAQCNTAGHDPRAHGNQRYRPAAAGVGRR